MTYYDHDDEQSEHECPRPLEWPAGQFNVGDQFLSPAGRWETVTGVEYQSIHVTVYTDRIGPDYGWSFVEYRQFPHLPGYLLGRRVMVVDDIRPHGTVIEAWIGDESDAHRGWYGLGCHVVVSASRQCSRGPEWVVVDQPDGAERREQTVASKAAARSLVKRLAKQHAKALGVPMWRDPTGGAR